MKCNVMRNLVELIKDNCIDSSYRRNDGVLKRHSNEVKREI